MRTLNDLDLTKKDKEKVMKLLEEWIEHYREMSNGRAGNVVRADFENMDLFYFTQCHDLMKENPEHKSVEDDYEIRKRKRIVLLQLFLRYLSGEKLGKTLKCTHCGYVGEIMKSTVNGHFRYCPKCGKIQLTGYDDTLIQSAVDVIKKVKK